MKILQTFNSLIKKVSVNLEKFVDKKYKYKIPDIWLPEYFHKTKPDLINVNPAEYFLNILKYIKEYPSVPFTQKNETGWSLHSVIYNLFIRSTTAFDHDQNGKIDTPLNKEGWRETGTFMKALALIPYIHSLGADTIHLLPITAIGLDGKKGTLGSPYAIKNPYRLDENLNEPNCGLTVDEEFKLFVLAAHHMGMRVVVEFVFRTASKDADWILEHPEWFYWIKETIPDRSTSSDDEKGYGNPIFTKEELIKIKSDVENGKLNELIPPHKIYRDIFTDPPPRESIVRKNGKLIGKLQDGTRVRIPGAFADWPPDDTQPPWSDVTYLKLYDHPDFNYIAYNTIRMYDTRLSQNKYAIKSLWEKILEIIPYYQNNFNIDGVMIDMGHSLPMELKSEMIKRARNIDPYFAFWDENFSVTEKSVKEGYDAVIGYQWSDQHHPNKFKNLLKRFTEGFPLPFFATPESHNTPRATARAGGELYSKYAWTTGSFIPAIPFIHSGFEIGETMPINTGLDFSKTELHKYPADKLPLFSEYAYNWCRESHMREWIILIGKIRNNYKKLIINKSPETFKWIETNNPDIICFVRSDKKNKIIIIGNSNMKSERKILINLKDYITKNVKDILSGVFLTASDGDLNLMLQPGQVMIIVEE